MSSPQWCLGGTIQFLAQGLCLEQAANNNQNVPRDLWAVPAGLGHPEPWPHASTPAAAPDSLLTDTGGSSRGQSQRPCFPGDREQGPEKERMGNGKEGEQSAQGSWPMPSSCCPVAGLTILAAGAIQLDDVGVVDLLQEVEF